MNRNTKLFNVLIFMIALAAVAYMGWNADTIGLSVEEDRLVISGPDEFSWAVCYDQIVEIELKEDPSYGQLLEGTDEDCKCGTWRNEEWGEYTLAAVDGVDVCVVIETSEGITVLSYESEESTREFHRAFLEYLQEKGSAAAA